MQHSNRFVNLVKNILPKIQETDATTVLDCIGRDEQLLIIDVRERDEWMTGHIPTAQHLSRGILERDIEKRVSNLDQPMVLYCGGGYRSALAAHSLQEMGYTNVSSMAGGMRAWREKGFDVVVSHDDSEKS